jgi:hypothetical protein
MQIFYTAFIFFLASCSNNSSVNKQFSAADSLVINFNTPQTNNIEKTMSTTDNNAIKKITKYVDSKKGEEYKCGYDGNLMFYKKGILAGDVSFNYSGNNCRHFMQTVDGKLTSTTMSNEAADFLKSLAEGKDWY